MPQTMKRPTSKMTSTMKYFILRLVVAFLIASTIEASQKLQLVASSPFTLLLQPVYERASQKSIKSLEDAIAITLLKQHNGSLYTTMQAPVQKVDFFESTNRSQIQFFALASRLPENQTLSFFRLELNSFVEHVLVESPLGRASLYRELVSSSDTILQDVENFEVVPLNPVRNNGGTISEVPDQSSNDSQALSTLDIVLIVCCGLICIGILYMIIQHHQDRGYIENQRLRALNFHNDTESQSDQQPIMLPKHSSLSYGDGTSIHSEVVAPSTPSTIHSINDRNGSMFNTPDRRDHRIIALTPKALLGASSVDGNSVESIVEGLESDWTRNDSAMESVNKEVEDEASSESSEDPFGVDVEASSAAHTAHDDDRSKASSTVQEWMMSLQVVSKPPLEQAPLSCNEAKTSGVTTQTSKDADSSGPSVAQTSLDVSSIDHRSLERSLASSDADELVVKSSTSVIKIEV